MHTESSRIVRVLSSSWFGRGYTSITLCLLATIAVPLVGCGGNPGEDSGSSSAANTSDTCSPSLATGAVTNFEKDLLNLIATTEGTRHYDANDGYDVTYAYHILSSCVHDTDVSICAGAYCSTAQGRYQFLYTTYQGLGLPNFEPNSQDVGAMKLVHGSGSYGAGVPSDRALTYGELVNVLDDISYQWASLPPGRYGQPSVSFGEAWSIYSGLVGSSGSGGGSACSLAGHTYGQNTCTETLQCDDGSWVGRSGDPSACNTGIEAGGACITDSGSVEPQNTCTSTLQCDDGVWVDRSGDPSKCDGSGGGSTSCKLAGHNYSQNTCTETLQCDNGNWVARSGDPSSCTEGVEPSGECITDTGAVVAQNTCTSTLQCDDGVWVDRYDDPAICN
jgi:muramidase (phage lysozyme)